MISMLQGRWWSIYDNQANSHAFVNGADGIDITEEGTKGGAFLATH